VLSGSGLRRLIGRHWFGYMSLQGVVAIEHFLTLWCWNDAGSAVLFLPLSFSLFLSLLQLLSMHEKDSAQLPQHRQGCE